MSKLIQRVKLKVGIPVCSNAVLSVPGVNASAAQRAVAYARGADQLALPVDQAKVAAPCVDADAQQRLRGCLA